MAKRQKLSNSWMDNLTVTQEIFFPTNQPVDVLPGWMTINEGLANAVIATMNRETPIKLNSSALFPYSLAAVSALWSEILASYPEFWTLVFFHVDWPSTPIDQASLQLQRSQNLPIHLVITRRDELRSTHDENDQIAAFVDLLRPHLSRCVSIGIDADLNSSLLIVKRCFTTPAPKLVPMEIACDAYDWEESPDDEEHPEYEAIDEDEDNSDQENLSGPEFGHNGLFPNLRRLVIDGRNFRQAGRRRDNWVLDQWTLKQLTITHFQTSDLLTYDLSDFFHDLSTFLGLESLKLHQVYVLSLGRPDNQYLHIKYLHLESVQDIFIQEFWKVGRFKQLLTLRITRSRIPLAIYLNVPSLILEDIPADLKLVEVVR
ncbi:hypothetical protein GALMADRAFT_873660 [Galerina marginata CBS 339.88]|uniref:F-box domain-containing protein n=1 Tax=Galerina marginata (strain CBS 339.88) TaxID=685588 RepID=A0A067TJ38_GALM3|nr:hypothetical protein GALMADRAFT_873660 [Galerina marginata CBS 339.88]